MHMSSPSALSQCLCCVVFNAHVFTECIVSVFVFAVFNAHGVTECTVSLGVCVVFSYSALVSVLSA